MMREQTKQRVQDADAQLVARGRPATKPYLVMREREVWEVLCKCCGHTIRKMMPVEDLTTKRVSKGVTVIQERLAMVCLANYREVMIEMDDGSAHVTNCCVACVSELANPDMLEAFYARDLEGWGQAHLRHANRKPIRVVRVANVIQE